MATSPNLLGYQDPAVLTSKLDSTTVSAPGITTPIVRENVQAFLTDDAGANLGYELRSTFQALLMELRAIRIGIQFLVSSQDDGSLNLMEAAQEYDEEVPT